MDRQVKSQIWHVGITGPQGVPYFKVTFNNNNNNTWLLYSAFSIISSKRFTQYYPSKDS